MYPAGQREEQLAQGSSMVRENSPPVPLAGMAVAHIITDAVPSFVGTILAQAGGGGVLVGVLVEFTVAAPEGRGTLARVAMEAGAEGTAPRAGRGYWRSPSRSPGGCGAEAGARGRVHTLPPLLHFTCPQLLWKPHPREAL